MAELFRVFKQDFLCQVHFFAFGLQIQERAQICICFVPYAFLFFLLQVCGGTEINKGLPTTNNVSKSVGSVSPRILFPHYKRLNLLNYCLFNSASFSPSNFLLPVTFLWLESWKEKQPES